MKRPRTIRTSTSGVLLGVALAALLAGCSSTPEGVDAQPVPMVSEGQLQPATGGGRALTYDPAQAPAGADLRVELSADGGGTKATLTARGLQPNRGYAVHAHQNPCGPTGDAAGPHYQNSTDPNTFVGGPPSTDPGFANPVNEMWLDLRTDASGSGTATTSVPWTIQSYGPNSIVLHQAMQTMTGPGVAGTAGGRLACLDLR